MSNLYSIIKSLQQAKGSNEKLAILQANKDNELLKEYLRATYDPAINWWMKKIIKTGKVGECEMDGGLIKWLLSEVAGRKITGGFAATCMRETNDALTEAGQELLQLLINRSVGAGVGDGVILKVWPDLYFIPPYQRCSLMDDKIRTKFSAMPMFYAQLKCDGSFSYLVQEIDGAFKAVTRNGTHYPSWFAEKLLPKNGRELKGFVAVGEIEVFSSENVILDRQTGNGILNSILKGAEEQEYAHLTFRQTCWDLLTVAEWKSGKSDATYSFRLACLQDFKGLTCVETHEVGSLEEAYKIYSKFTSEAKEGAVIKAPTSLWKDGTAKDIVKLKIAFEAEYVITAIYEGTGKAKGMLGGITIETSDGLLKCNCGSGFTDQMRKDYWKIGEGMVGTIVTIIANDVIGKRGSDIKSLFLPIFSMIRFDKGEADSLPRVLSQLEAAKGIH